MTQHHKKILCYAIAGGISSLALLSTVAYGHGLMVQPPSRNATCGMPEDQKPHNATNPACIEAFQDDSNGGYQFMSVLTHDVGRQGVSPLPKNVCGFDSETWDNNNNGNTTPWDKPLDWPTTPVSAGPFEITWNISWGPHFDDTEEFVYYITKPGFEYQVGVPLTWDDFESEPFCKQTYNDATPNANPNVVPNVGDTTFATACELPERSGRHVVYGEWGRNYFTFERFHGCIDVSYGESDGGPTNVAPTADSQSVTLDENTNIVIEFSGSDSDGTIDSYSISSQPQNGSLSGSGDSRTYTPNAGFVGSDQFAFQARDNDGALSASAIVDITVNESDDGVIVNQAPTAAFTFAANDLAVSFAGGMSSDPDNAPVSPLSYSWDFGDGNTTNGVGPVHTYEDEGVYSVSLTVSDGDLTDTITQAVTVTNPIDDGNNNNASCSYEVTNSWNSGFVAEITIANNGTSAIDGWSVSWSYDDGSAMTNSWNAIVEGSDSSPYTASNISWNGLIQPGQSVVFGFQGSHNGATSPVSVTGDVCN